MPSPWIARSAAQPLTLQRLLVTTAVALSLVGALAACSPPDEPSGGPATTPATAATTTTVPVAPTPPDPTAGWTPYSDATAHFSLRFPPSWLQRTCPGAPYTGLFLAPTSAALAICNSDFTGQMSVVAFDGDLRGDLHLSGTGLTATAVTAHGVAGSRESATAVASETGLGPAAGSVLVAYVFFTGGRTYRAGYVQAPSGATSTNVLADFDLMVMNTLQFT